MSCNTISIVNIYNDLTYNKVHSLKWYYTLLSLKKNWAVTAIYF